MRFAENARYEKGELFVKKFLSEISCVLICLISVATAACGKTPDLYRAGVEVTTLMGETTNSEQYREVMGISDEQTSLVKANDYDSPARAYKISVPTFETLYEKMNNEGVLRLDELSDDLKEQAKTRLNIYTVLNFVNMHYGSASCLAASSVFTAEKRFDGKIASSVVYLYIFETGIPIAVVFEPFGEKQFTAKGIFLWAGDTSALSKVREVFEPFGCNVENIQQN